MAKKFSKQKYLRKETYSPSEVLDFIPDLSTLPPKTKLKKIKRDYDGDAMKMVSDRYYTFAKSLKCAFCDLVGSIMCKEKSFDKHGNIQEGGFHFNLYAIDANGEEMLMTKDHILAKSKGGLNHIDNYTTCCSKCNFQKQDMDIEDFKKLKNIK